MNESFQTFLNAKIKTIVFWVIIAFHNSNINLFPLSYFSSWQTIVYCQKMEKFVLIFSALVVSLISVRDFLTRNSSGWRKNSGKTISVHLSLQSFSILPFLKQRTKNSWRKVKKFHCSAIFRKTKVFNGKFIIYAFCTLFFYMNNCSECKKGKTSAGLECLKILKEKVPKMLSKCSFKRSFCSKLFLLL